jgi:hypothetical protein
MHDAGLSKPILVEAGPWATNALQIHFHCVSVVKLLANNL